MRRGKAGRIEKWQGLKDLIGGAIGGMILAVVIIIAVSFLKSTQQGKIDRKIEDNVRQMFTPR
jgi:hypothetical protein